MANPTQYDNIYHVIIINDDTLPKKMSKGMNYGDAVKEVIKIVDDDLKSQQKCLSQDEKDAIDMNGYWYDDLGSVCIVRE